MVGRFELERAEETYRFVLSRRENEVKPGAEDPWLHKRKVTPGDYKEKLQPETIAELDRRFAGVLKTLRSLRPENIPSAFP